jgi:hypothetical protein
MTAILVDEFVRNGNFFDDLTKTKKNVIKILTSENNYLNAIIIYIYIYLL